jgi:hypothetical protein
MMRRVGRAPTGQMENNTPQTVRNGKNREKIGFFRSNWTSAPLYIGT